MKQNYILLLIFTLFLFSCDNEDTFTVETTLPLTLSFEVSEASAIEHQSGRTDYAFKESETYNLSDNNDLKDNLDDITNILSKGFSTKIDGLAEGDTINSLTISIAEKAVGMYVTDTLYTTSTEDLGFVSYPFGDVLMEEKQVTVTVEGTTRKAPMNFEVNMELIIWAILTEE